MSLDQATMSLEQTDAAASTGTVAESTAGAPFILPSEGVDLDELERSLIEQALTRTQGNQSQAARLLGLSRYALRYRIRKYGFTSRFPPAKRRSSGTSR